MRGETTAGVGRSPVELLAPAGSVAAFDAALAAGADAIYVGFGSDFNARRLAENFDDETLCSAARKAHLVGARVYVTMNVVIKEREMSKALSQALRAWQLGADALIVQDWGLLGEVRRRWPEIECHASTQMAIQDPRGCLFARGRGVSRVTLARELSLGEIAACARTGVEIEAFCHGALCFCYSGLCLMSSLGGARSANRGMCAQPCRLPYDLVDGGGRRVAVRGADRPLCPRDLRTIDDLPALLGAGVSSLKIEGRMKAPEYVFAVVSAYRSKLDELGAGGAIRARKELGDVERADLLRRAFNRDFTDAYLWGTSGNEMMSYERSNNRGELVGHVVASRDLGRSRVRRGGRDGGRERFRSVSRAEIEVGLDRPVGAGDLLELRPLDDPSQFVTAPVSMDAAAGSRVTVRAARVVPKGSTARVIRSQAVLDAVGRIDAGHPRLRPVDVSVTARRGLPLAVEIATTDGRARVRATGAVVEAARTKAVNADELVRHATRLGGTPFEAHGGRADVGEGVGLSFSEVHRVRAKAVSMLVDVLLAPFARDAHVVRAPDGEDLLAQRDSVPGRKDVPAAARGGQDMVVCALVGDVATARSVAGAGVTRIYADEGAFDDVSDALGGATSVFPWLDEVCRLPDHPRLDRLVRRNGVVVASNVSELRLALDHGACPEIAPSIPVHNVSALLALEELGAKGIWLSSELTLDEMRALAFSSHVPLGLFVFGRTQGMTSEHCVLQASGECRHDCVRCALRRRAHFLVSPKGDRYPVTSDAHGRSRVWAPRPLDATSQAAALREIGVGRLMVDARLLSPDEASAAVRKALAGGVTHAERSSSRQAGTTVGHLLAGVE